MNEERAVQGSWAGRIKSVTGLDRAIAYTVAARVAQILGSTGTVLLVIRFLSPVEQGYYYTLLSLVALQMIFEFGFSFVVLQMAAHECIHLKLLPEGHIEGDGVAHARLASILQKTTKFYAVAAFVMVLVILPIGEMFLSRRSVQGEAIAWQGPWISAVAATGATFFVTPFLSFLEGCGEIRSVARTRMVQALLVAGTSWLAIISGNGLYATAWVNVACSAAGLAFIISRRRWLMALLRFSPGTNTVNWRSEVWSFQWKIGVSWLCGYLSMQIFTPILFGFRGPIEAGRMGMSMSIGTYAWTIVSAWISTKATPFGRLAAQKDFESMDRLFFRTLRQSLGVLSGIIVFLMSAVLVAARLSSTLSSRIVPPAMFVLILITAVSTFIVQSQALYIRSHKREPFLAQSVAVAIATGIGVLLTVNRWGTWGIAWTYFFCSGLMAVIASTLIFVQTRKKERAEDLCATDQPIVLVYPRAMGDELFRDAD